MTMPLKPDEARAAADRIDQTADRTRHLADPIAATLRAYADVAEALEALVADECPPDSAWKAAEAALAQAQNDMSDRIEDGGQAFPMAGSTDLNWNHTYPEYGLTVRDWFAGQALAGLYASGPYDCYQHGMAHDAYLAADAMIAARKGSEA